VATFSAAGVYGKIPDQADFVRVRAADAVARPLALWLEEGSEDARRAGAPTRSEPVRFLFRPSGEARALVGVLAASVDRVGRSFPLALFSQVGGPDLASAFPALPRAAAAFLEAAATLVREAARLTARELAASLERLPLPTAADVAAGAAEAHALAAAESGRAMLARLFGDAANGQRLYALHCFRSACRAVRGREPARAAAVLDCPVRGDVDRWAWLELARRGLAWQAPPSFFWWEPSGSRLLISLGPVPASVFGALWRADPCDARVWPLVTDKPAAIAAAERALGAPVLDALAREALPLGDLFDVVMP
jgi:type VI secretion system protein ImpM